MSLDNSAVVPALPTGGYQIEQSLRFNDDDSAYLSWTPSSAGNRKKFTFSFWVKPCDLAKEHYMFNAGTSNSGWTEALRFYQGYFQWTQVQSNSSAFILKPARRFRDPSAWYHIVCAMDTTQSTSSDRAKVYINGEQVTTWATEQYPSLNYESYFFNNANIHAIGIQTYNYNSGQYFNGYLSEINFIDGQQLDPTYFGETGDYGEWKAKAYSGSYGTNGYYLNFSGTYYNDQSGNGNNWTANNLSTTDVVLDSPTNNFAILNTMWQNDYGTYKEGNLDFEGPYNHHTPSATSIPMASGKWYMEFRAISGSKLSFGVLSNLIKYRKSGTTNYIPGEHTTQDYTGDACVWYYNRIEHNASIISYPFSSHVLTSPNVYMIAFDADSGKVWFGKEGEWNNNGSVSSTLNTSSPDVTMSIEPGDSFSFHATAETSRWKVNCGQDSSFSGSETAQNNQDENGYGDFTYTPPSGFLALCTANLPDPAVIPNENFGVVTYSGNSVSYGSGGQSITGLNFQPDMVWIKARNETYNHYLVDTVRGTSSGNWKLIQPNLSSAETSVDGPGDAFVSMDTNGFTVAYGTSSWAGTNESGKTYVAWSCKFNGSGSSNTNGDITSTVSANQDAGCSVVLYTGAGGNKTIGHGLSKAPEMIFVKRRSTAGAWAVYNYFMGADKGIYLNLSNGAEDQGTFWASTDPTSTVFTVGTDTQNSASGVTYVAYCFHSVPGFSQLGLYTPNQSTNGPFIYTGFQPAFVLIKNLSRTQEWIIVDHKRNNDYNPQDRSLRTDSNASEGTGNDIDFLSNGFKIRTSGSGVNYASGDTMMYMAFAEVPTKYANAR